MGLNINSLVVQCLECQPGEKRSAREIAQWIFANFRADCEEKRKSSRQNLTRDVDLINQITAEIAANRPTIERNTSRVRTTETKPKLYYYTTVTEEVEVHSAEHPQSQELRPIENQTNRRLADRLLETDLYPLLSSYLYTQHGIYPKRIDERKSSNSRFGPNGNKWLYPDLVGMQDLGAHWDAEIQKCVKVYGDKRIRLWSFEVKLLLNRSNVRESWFQAVSNSSWANYGYLVASEIATGVIAELRMLSAVHGIGVMLLDTQNPAESEILIPARERPDIDWEGCNRLVEENSDFKSFIELVREFHQTDKAKYSDWNISSFGGGNS